MESSRRHTENFRFAEKSTGAVTGQWAVRDKLHKTAYLFCANSITEKIRDTSRSLAGEGPEAEVGFGNFCQKNRFLEMCL